VAQDLERQIRRIWQVYRENPAAHEKARGLLSRLRDVIDELGTVKVDYDDWQVLYRQTLQLERALRGQPQLLQSTTSQREAKMKTEDKVPGIATAAPAAASTGELVSELFKQSAELVKKEVALAKAEVLVEVKQEVKMAERLGVAAVCALCGLNLLLVAAAMALAHVLPAWAAALVVAGVVLLVGGLAAWLGWGKRVKQPLERTQRTLKEDVRWAKERLA
jgi:putative superfamily III holin-X